MFAAGFFIVASYQKNRRVQATAVALGFLVSIAVGVMAVRHIYGPISVTGQESGGLFHKIGNIATFTKQSRPAAAEICQKKVCVFLTAPGPGREAI